jgi:4-alpha-glucanotransferase
MSLKTASLTELRFRVPYWTKWGQTVVIIGTWDGAAKRGYPLTCRHEGDSLLWEGKITVPIKGDHLCYKYAVLNEAGEVETEEIGTRRLVLPKGLLEGSSIDLHDEWQVGGCVIHVHIR